MLNNHQRAELKALASKLNIRYQIGKNELSDSLLTTLANGLKAHELIKIDVMKGYDKPLHELAIDLSIKLNAEIVQEVGRVIVLYKRNNEKPVIKLSK